LACSHLSYFLVFDKGCKRSCMRVGPHSFYLLYTAMLQVQAVFAPEPVDAGSLFWEIVGLRPPCCGFGALRSAASLLLFFDAIFSGFALFLWDTACHHVPGNPGLRGVQCVLQLSSFEPVTYSRWAYTITVSHSVPSERVGHLGDLAPTHPPPAGSYIRVIGAWLTSFCDPPWAVPEALDGLGDEASDLEKVTRFV
jgi:hypothetical protein